MKRQEQKRERDFTRACKTLVDKACETDAALRRRLKPPLTFWGIAKSVGGYSAFALGVVMCIGFVVAPAVFCCLVRLWQPNELCIVGIALATCSCIVFIGSRAQTSQIAFSHPSVLFYLPFHADDFRSLTRRELISSPPWIFCLSQFLLLCSIAYRCDALGWENVLLACGLSVLCALASWTVALWVAHTEPVRQIVPFMYFVTFFTIVFGTFMYIEWQAVRAWINQQIVGYGKPFVLLTPGGWAVSVFSANARALAQGWWYALIPLFGFSLSLPLALRSLERRFDIEKFWLMSPPEDEDAMEDECPREPSECGHGAQGQSPVIVDMEEVRRHWAPVCEISRIGWLERLFVRRLSAEDRATLEHVSLTFPRWTLRTLFCAGIWIVAAPIMFFTSDMSDSVFREVLQFVAGMGLILPITLMLILTFPPYTGIKSVVTYGRVYPFSFRRFFSIRHKASIARCLAVAPIYLVLGWVFKGYQGVFLAVQILLMATLGFSFVPYFHSPVQPWLSFPRTLLRFLDGLGFVILIVALIVASFLPFIPLPVRLLCTLLFILACRWWQSVFLVLHDRGDYGISAPLCAKVSRGGSGRIAQ